VTIDNVRHLVRLRSDDDSEYLLPGALDGVLINANHLEQRPAQTIQAVVNRNIPFLIDPMLSRFQVPNWSQRTDGQMKRNFEKLALLYTRDIGIRLGQQPIIDVIQDSKDWAKLASNVVSYQRSRLSDEAGGLLQAMKVEGQFEPSEIIAPCLLATSRDLDATNHTLLAASAEASGRRVLAQVAVPIERFRQPGELASALSAIQPDLALGCLLWIERLTEERTLAESMLLENLLSVLEVLSSRRIMVWHAHGQFSAMTLRPFGMTGVIYPLAWVDRGMPAGSPTGGQPSCRTYLTSGHHDVQFVRAAQLAERLTPEGYLENYCNCYFCRSAIEAGDRPLELMLEIVQVKGPHGYQPRPTERALSFNRWHYLWSRHKEAADLSSFGIVEVLQRDINRAASLGDVGYLDRLVKLFRAA